jgi:hypothetical protein
VIEIADGLMQVYPEHKAQRGAGRGGAHGVATRRIGSTRVR